MGNLTAKSGLAVELPMFIPVHRPDYGFDLFSESYRHAGLSACMVNSFFLYKNRETRTQFKNGLTLREHIGGFDGLICTDSGAFQGLKRQLYLENKTIVKFQNMIQSDVAAPVDLITPPGDGRTEAESKMMASHKRILEALPLCGYSLLAGMQQGGRFFDLRQKHIRLLAELDLRYYGIGSLVPFFNRKHDLHFCCKVISDARLSIGQGKAMHVYGAGDPVEIPFLYRAGANVFDSSSYAHFAEAGSFMTPYGAVPSLDALLQMEYQCPCPICKENEEPDLFNDKSLLKQHNLHQIFMAINMIRSWKDDADADKCLADILQRHMKSFPDSKLKDSWDKFALEAWGA
jgi:tRNA-guanine family transglycosylase